MSSCSSRRSRRPAQSLDSSSRPARHRGRRPVEAAHVGFIIGELIAGAQALTVTVPGRGEFPLPCPRRESPRPEHGVICVRLPG